MSTVSRYDTSKIRDQRESTANIPEFRVTLIDEYGSYHYTIFARTNYEALQKAIKRADLKQDDILDFTVRLECGKKLRQVS